MKRTQIQFKQINGSFVVTNMNEVATEVQIAQHFGPEIADEYVNNYPCYFRDEETDVVYVFEADGTPWFLKPNTPYDLSKLDFGHLVATLKQSGDRLQGIVSKNKIKTIDI